jgi:DNA mismatch repair ATPase MutS
MLLLDEILRGTNSTDRHRGAKALLRQLIGSNAVGVVATHDLGLALPELIGNGKLDPFYFDVQVEDDNLYFDYKLHPGTCKTLNASILMRKMGIDVDVYGAS